jgi:hypothetical protein
MGSAAQNSAPPCAVHLWDAVTPKLDELSDDSGIRPEKVFQ